MAKPKVFLSHSSKDKPRVREIQQLLEAKGIQSWLDEEEIRVGESFITRLNQGLEECPVLVVFLSSHSITSDWVNLELGAALATSEVYVIPVRVDDSELPPLLKSLHYADLRTGNVEAVVSFIEKAIEKAAEAYNVPELPIFRKTGASKNFRFVILSGLSAAGKDTILAILEANLSGEFPVEVLTKYTTRPKRIYEAPYSKAISESEFQKFEKQKSLIYSYKKRRARYGFDREQFERCVAEGDLLFSVFTQFDLVPKVAKNLRDQGLNPIPIFLKVSRDHLERRTILRYLEDADKAVRAWSIRSDLHGLDARHAFDDEYVVLANGDDKGVEGTAKEIEEIIRQSF